MSTPPIRFSSLLLCCLGGACASRRPPVVAPSPPVQPAAPVAPVAPSSPGDPGLHSYVGGSGSVASTVLDTSAIGSVAHPVLANGPTGQREYLMRLICADGKAPTFARNGNVGSKSDNHIVDLYAVRCADGSSTRVYMDMYHADREMRPIPGFTILPETPARMATGCPPRLSSNADSNITHIFTLLEVATAPRLVDPLPAVIPGYGVTGSQQVDFVVDTLGVPDLASIKAGPLNASDRFAAAQKLVATMRFTPAEHHPGCKVPYRFGVTLRFGEP